MSIDINKHEVEIDTLFKQNELDLCSIKELYRKLKEIEKKITQIKYIDTKLADKLKKDYESLKRIILDENIQVELSSKIDELNTQLNNITTEIEKVKTEYYLSNDTTLNMLIDLMPSTGGTIIIPSGKFYVDEDVILNKPITIKGYGDESVLVMNKSIISDTNPLNSLYFKDFKVLTTSSNPAFILDKRITNTIYEGNPTLNTDLRIENLKFYTEFTNGTFIKIKQLCNSSIVNTIFQCKNINTSGYNALDIESDGKLGIRNLSIENCKFVGLDYAIKCIGDKTWYTHTCGLMINNTLIMDSNYGVYGENLDWLTFSDGMIDYTDFPIKTMNVSNLKVKNNYIFSRRREISSACVEYVVEDTESKISPEIVGNHMWNSSYGNLVSGVTTTGIMIKCRAVNENSELINGIISNNTIHRVNHAINISTEQTNNLTSKIKYFSIHDNNIYMCNRGIYSKGVVENTIAPNNLFNTVVKAIESESNIPLSNILTKTIQINLKGTRYNQTPTGVPHENIISVNLIYDDNVFTFKASAYLKQNNDIIGVMTIDQTPSDKDYIFTVEVKYIASW